MVLRQLKCSPNLNETSIVLRRGENCDRNSKLFAAVMSVGTFAIPCAVGQQNSSRTISHPILMCFHIPMSIIRTFRA